MDFLIINVKKLEEPGIEPGAFHMQSERATTALHPLDCKLAAFDFTTIQK